MKGCPRNKFLRVNNNARSYGDDLLEIYSLVRAREKREMAHARGLARN